MVAIKSIIISTMTHHPETTIISDVTLLRFERDSLHRVTPDLVLFCANFVRLVLEMNRIQGQVETSLQRYT